MVLSSVAESSRQIVSRKARLDARNALRVLFQLVVPGLGVGGKLSALEYFDGKFRMRWQATVSQYVTCMTSSQMLCALPIGRRAASWAVMPSRIFQTGSPCQALPLITRSY